MRIIISSILLHDIPENPDPLKEIVVPPQMVRHTLWKPLSKGRRLFERPNYKGGGHK
jgi:hypothetical protein